MDTLAASLPATARAEPTLRLGQFARLLRRHLWLIALCAVVAGAAAFLYAHTLPKTYTATSSLTVEGNHFAIPEVQGALSQDNTPDPMPWVRTEVQAITARALIERVVTQLQLDRLPEFNPALRPPTLAQEVKDWVGGVIAALLPKGPKTAPESGPNEAVLAAATKALTVFQDNRSLVIAVSFTSRDPVLAASFINTLVTGYEQTRAHNRIAANQDANGVLAKRIEQVRGELTDIEHQMAALRTKGEMVGLRAGGVGQQEVEDLATAAARATLDRSQLEASYDRAQAATKAGSSDELAAVLNSPTISHLRDQEAQAQRRIAQMSTQYGSAYPGVRAATAQLAAARDQLRQEAARIVASLGTQLRVARAQEANVQQQLDQARHQAVAAENQRAQLDQLQQEAVTRRTLYQTLLESEQRTLGQAATTDTPDVRLLSPAVPPGLPSGPNMKLAGLMGGAGGALFGCLVALARRRGADGFDAAGEVTAATGLPVLATLPRRLLRRGSDDARRGGGDAVVVEAMRGLRARLRFAGRSGAPRAVVFVPVDGDDASGPAASLAVSFARVAAGDGERVLLMEGDLRGRPLSSLFDRSVTRDGIGLATVLTGTVSREADWREALAHDRQPNLDLLLAAERVSDGPALLSGVAFQNLLVETRAEYDLVVLDAPHAGSADAQALVQRVDAAVLVIGGHAGAAATQAATQRLGAAARTPLVAVLLARA